MTIAISLQVGDGVVLATDSASTIMSTDGEVQNVRLHDLRHSFGTAMAAAVTPMRMLMEWMGHADIKTTMIYADYSPDPSGGRVWAERAFGRGTDGGTDATERNATERGAV